MSEGHGRFKDSYSESDRQKDAAKTSKTWNKKRGKWTIHVGDRAEKEGRKKAHGVCTTEAKAWLGCEMTKKGEADSSQRGEPHERQKITPDGLRARCYKGQRTRFEERWPACYGAIKSRRPEKKARWVTAWKAGAFHKKKRASGVTQNPPPVGDVRGKRRNSETWDQQAKPWKQIDKARTPGQPNRTKASKMPAM